MDQSRGQGATKSLPVTTFAEDNVLMLPCCGHRDESILVHEVAHSVMNLGFDAALHVRPRRSCHLGEQSCCHTLGHHLWRTGFETTDPLSL